ncbi:MAG: hypothetical protein GQ546_14065 [Gammaproteobacteria bacterium]|nr:hypothetical protein [Gammaproteobacteria bacterium]
MAELALNDEYFPKSPVGTGTSRAFDELAEFTKNMFLASSFALIDERPKDLRDELVDMFKECSVDNWDSYGSLPLKERAFFEAEKFISAMPSWLPIPEIVPEPSGDIGFQWDFGRDKVLVASLSGDNIVIYAAILGSTERKRNGSDVFNDTIPNEIINRVGEIQN